MEDVIIPVEIAAEFLSTGYSKLTLLSLLYDFKEIPYSNVDGKNVVNLKDVFAYEKERYEKRKKALDKLKEQGFDVDGDLY